MCVAPFPHRPRSLLPLVRCSRRSVEAWLQRFRGTVGSWRLCLQLLALPQAQQHELLFAANTIKASAQKNMVGWWGNPVRMDRRRQPAATLQRIMRQWTH